MMYSSLLHLQSCSDPEVADLSITVTETTVTETCRDSGVTIWGIHSLHRPQFANDTTRNTA